MDIGVIVTIIVSAVGATWALRSALGGVESALKEHAAEDAANFKDLRDNVVQLKSRTTRKR